MPKPEHAYLVCHRLTAYASLNAQMGRPQAFKDILIFSGLTSGFIGADIDGLEVKRYLDRYYLVLPLGFAHLREATLAQFFDWLSPGYDAAIDTSRNVDNIFQLLALLERNLGSLGGRTILDFGCGTGLAMGQASSLGANILGFDSCAGMREIASRNGMTTIALDELISSSNAFDGVFASYVFHFCPAPEGISAAYHRLRRGGIFVGNCHKDAGLTHMRSIFENLGGSTSIVPGGIHGPYLRCEKPESECC